jgi:hypothetical protein
MEVTADHVVVREDPGGSVALQRLAAGATQFFAVADGRWRQLPRSDVPATARKACVEAVPAGSNLLALRVFLGSTCGPA